MSNIRPEERDDIPNQMSKSPAQQQKELAELKAPNRDDYHHVGEPDARETAPYGQMPPVHNRHNRPDVDLMNQHHLPDDMGDENQATQVHGQSIGAGSIETAENIRRGSGR